MFLSSNPNVVVIATRNQGKVKEFTQLFHDRGIEVRSLSDFASLPDVIEDGETFLDNAMKKAKEIALQLKLPVLADDSGLCVDALDGAPGVRSARYAGDGEKSGDKANNAKLLQVLQEFVATDGNSDGSEGSEGPNGLDGPSPRALSPAQFVCALVLYNPTLNEALQVQESCEGFIISEPRGEQGFGYDPLFYLPQFSRTMAELTVEEKNRISHRAKALESLLSLDYFHMISSQPGIHLNQKSK